MLAPLRELEAGNHQDFTKLLIKHLGEEIWQIHGEIICKSADLG